jgi:hypothetical protein
MVTNKTIKVTEEDYKLLLGYLEAWNCNSFAEVVTLLLSNIKEITKLVTSGNFTAEQIDKITELVTKVKEVSQ